MTTIHEWLKHGISIFGLSAPAWTFIAIAVGVVVEWALGRFAPTSCASLIALIATGLRFLLTPFGRIPGVGPMVLRALESIAGVDLDGDGHIGDKPPAQPPAAIVGVFLMAMALGQMGCAHFKPVVSEFTDCAAPDVEAACHELVPRVVEVVACTGGSKEMLPACAVSGLADLYRDHGRTVVNCAMIAIRDAFSAPPGATPEQLDRALLVRRRAAEAIKREEARGVRFVARPAP